MSRPSGWQPKSTYKVQLTALRFTRINRTRSKCMTYWCVLQLNLVIYKVFMDELQTFKREKRVSTTLSHFSNYQSIVRNVGCSSASDINGDLLYIIMVMCRGSLRRTPLCHHNWQLYYAMMYYGCITISIMMAAIGWGIVVKHTNHNYDHFQRVIIYFSMLHAMLYLFAHCGFSYANLLSTNQLRVRRCLSDSFAKFWGDVEGFDSIPVR